jgi:transposase
MGIRVLKRAYKYRFYPTPEQADLLNRTFGSVRYVYNRALAERSRAWTQEQKRVCAAFGARHDRDVNAAKVVRAEGLSVQACGDGVRPSRA